LLDPRAARFQRFARSPPASESPVNQPSEDLNVTPYPEARVYKKVAKDICLHLRNPADLVLIMREQRLFFSKPEIGYRCWEL